MKISSSTVTASQWSSSDPLSWSHMDVIHRSVLKDYIEAKTNARKLILAVTIVSAFADVGLAVIAVILAGQRGSASIFAFSAECILDFVSSGIVLWQFMSNPSKRTEYLACALLGGLFVLSGLVVAIKAVSGIAHREHPVMIPVLVVLSSCACMLCASLALLKFWVAHRVTRLHCGISAKTVALDGIGSLLSGFCAFSFVVGAVVYRHRKDLWFIDSAMSTFAGVVMALIGARIMHQHGL